MKVRSVMSPHSYISIDGSWSLCEAARFFKSMKADFLQISNNGKFLGILSKDRFQRLVKSRGYGYSKMSRTSVLEFMDSDQPFCRPNEPLVNAYRTMKRHDLQYLAVRNLENIVGVVKFSSAASAIAVSKDYEDEPGKAKPPKT